MALDPDLVEFRQDITIYPGQPYDQVTFFGLNPILVQQQKEYNVIVQTGYAVGWQKIPVAPSPVFPTQLLERPQITVSQIDALRWRRSWTYVMAAQDNYAPDHAAICAWPAAPVTFEPAPT